MQYLGFLCGVAFIVELAGCDESARRRLSEDVPERFVEPTTQGLSTERVPFGPGLGQFARLTSTDSEMRLDLAFFALSEEARADLCERYDDRCLVPGEYVPVLQLQLPKALRLPYSKTADEDDVDLIWFRPEIVVGLDDDSSCTRVEGGIECAQRWVRQLLNRVNSDLDVSIVQLEPRPGGAVDIDVVVQRFALEDETGGRNFCCGKMNYRLHGKFDSDMWISVTEMTPWPNSRSCGFAALADVPSPEDCPAAR